jgi:hypothetical protein
MNGVFKLRAARSKNIAPRGEAPVYQDRMVNLLVIPGAFTDRALVDALREIRDRIAEQGEVEITWTGHLRLD